MQKNKIQEAIRLFNTSLSKGIKALEQTGLIDFNSPASISKFFYEHAEELSKAKIGEFFGEPDEMNRKTLRFYLNLTNLKGLPIDEALRSYLKLFELPGEAQKIDRILEDFSNKYIQDNPESHDAGVWHSLSYLLMM